MEAHVVAVDGATVRQAAGQVGQEDHLLGREEVLVAECCGRETGSENRLVLGPSFDVGSRLILNWV